jgi:hypothetical protein
MKIAILYICTGSYRVFFDAFHDSCEQHFLQGHDKTYFVFTDEPLDKPFRGVEYVQQDNLGWPGNTLDRFTVFTKVRDQLAEFDHIFFFNANCQLVEPVGEEILAGPGEIVVVRHPGHHDKAPGELPYERNPISRAYIPAGEGKHYVAGGVNGGSRDAYIGFIDTMRDAVEADKRSGVMAFWHDESHLNRYILDHPYRLLDPGYCYPQGWNLPFAKKILVRDKSGFGGALTLRKTRRWRAPDETIVVELLGRMGNQMFQYATARAAALRCGAKVIFDPRSLHRLNHPYDMGHFDIKARVGGSKELCPTKDRWLKRLAWRTLSKIEGRFIRERHNRFDPRVLTAKPATELRGYWQSEKYFADFADQIRQDFAITVPPTAANADMMRRIEGSLSVSVHVRRGDYVTSDKARGIYAVCGMDYYSRAAQHMLEALGEDPVFYVFSDDPEWARSNLELPGEMIVVDINGAETAYEDLRLMASCRHNIIANSTFSWWGAWLNPSTDKIVVGPKTWYLHPSLSNEYITPNNWRKIEN